MPSLGQKEETATGWEEPSPESVRRRMEIDDGTAAWGDPGKTLRELPSLLQVPLCVCVDLS